MKTQINYSDSDYRTAVNYDNRNYYNFPVTISLFFRGREEKKWILGCGSSDQIKVKTRDKKLFIVGENSRLDYISLTVINPFKDQTEEVYISNDGITALELKQSIFDYSTNYQIKVLSNYIL
jgi:hypothetical protein